MERSSLTDELEQPVSDSLYESSDNSQSIQRRRNCRCCFEGQNHDCSTSMMDSPVQNKLFGLPASDVQELVPTPLREVCNSPQRARINIDKKSEMALTESLYKELVVNWIPSPLQKHLDVGDQEWLFERKRPRSDMLETLNASKDVLDHGNSTSCPYNHCFLHSPSMINSGVQKTISLDPTPVKEPISSACGVPTTDSQVQHHSSSQGGRVDADEKFEMAPKCTCSETSLMQTDSQYRELVMNQVPPSSRSKHFDIGDQEWLFQTKQPRSDTRDTSTADYGVFHQGNFTQYPHAQYLPEVNIHALPYTIPY
ncbi:hypothetical protein COLO4_17333 [Corchorus olitorius]|uniref:Uncharacterized protein n=1 Tax=Corchorus olitorius TaxID=93759 RepID=A0A1R3JD77_9ROSI|nr:hypothetical protein COLO4_17333 [Corchorus olitorius]